MEGRLVRSVDALPDGCGRFKSPATVDYRSHPRLSTTTTTTTTTTADTVIIVDIIVVFVFFVPHVRSPTGFSETLALCRRLFTTAPVDARTPLHTPVSSLSVP